MIFPSNWAKSRLGEITIIKTGKLDANAAVDNGEYPFFTCSEKPLRIDHFEFDTEAVLLAGNGGFSVNWYKGKFNAYQRTYVIEPFHSYGRFVYRLVQFLIPIISSANRGSTIKYLRLGDISDAEVRLPPLEEQRRIADKLDITLARVDALNDRLARITPLLKRFRQSVLAAATSGRLTEDWREANQGASVWLNTTFDAVISDLRYGTSKKCEANAQGIAVLRIPNVGSSGSPDLTDLKFAEFDEKEYSKLSLIEGDLLTIRSNGSVDLVGKTCVVDKKAEGLLFAGYLIRMRLDKEKINPLFAYYVISSPSVRAHIELTAKSTSGVNNINSEEVRALPLALPSLEEQTEIVRRVETLFAFADRLEARLQSAQTAAERLTPALLAKAFRGELVPQDPNDEPATELLRRLREARAADAAAAKPKRGSAAKNAAALGAGRVDKRVRTTT